MLRRGRCGCCRAHLRRKTSKFLRSGPRTWHTHDPQSVSCEHHRQHQRHRNSRRYVAALWEYQGSHHPLRACPRAWISSPRGTLACLGKASHVYAYARSAQVPSISRELVELGCAVGSRPTFIVTGTIELFHPGLKLQSRHATASRDKYISQARDILAFASCLVSRVATPELLSRRMEYAVVDAGEAGVRVLLQSL